MIISIDAEKNFDKFNHPFMTKILSKLGVNGNFLNMIKNIYENTTANIIVKGERRILNTLKARSRQIKARHLTLTRCSYIEIKALRIADTKNA